MSAAATAVPPPGVQPDAAELRRLADLMADAFHDDPIQAWIFPDARTRPKRQRIMFRSELRHLGLHHGRVLTGPDAVAIWYAPERWRAPLSSLLRQAIPIARSFGRRLLPVIDLVHKLEEVHPSEPHWYLDWVAVDPRARGQGRSSAVVRPVLDHCDAHSLPAYLVSSKPENVPIYGSFGFRVTREVQPRNDAPPLWTMWREPKAPHQRT